MLFRFELKPVDEIAPWTTPSQNNEKFLSWFGLTDGIYWLDVGDAELFRYNPAILTHWAKTYPEAEIDPHVDYQVVRLWEDVIYMLPMVLEPVPEDMARHVRSGGAWESRAAWERWWEKASDWGQEQDDDASWELYDQASGWWRARALDSGHFRASPSIWFWREGDTVFVRWDNRGILLDGFPVWSAEVGEVSMTAAAFLEEVRSFDGRLISAMAERVNAAQNWYRPEIRLDWNGLNAEHQQRATTFRDVLTHPPLSAVPADWNAARAAFAELERHLAEQDDSR